MSIFNYVFEDIKNKFDYNRPNIIYIAVGSANNVDQQFPPFLINLITKYNPKISIILIDGLLEDIPISKLIISGYDIELYTIKENVVFNENDLQMYNDKITFNYIDKIKMLNQYCMDTYTTLIYQSYTGVYMREIAELFDKDITKHLDHIIYGIGERDNTGCFIDFTNKKYDFLTKFNQYIHIYNPYYYSLNDIPFEEAIDFYGIENIHEIIEKNNYAKIMMNEYFIEKILPVFRTFFLILKDPDTELHPYIWNYLPNNLNLHKLYESKQYGELFKQIKILYSQSLIIKFVISFANLKISPNEFIDIITANDNPYKWIDHFNLLVR